MRYRKLTPLTLTDSGGDMTFGHSQRDFFKDVPDAPGQAVLTRLKLWQGEWFLNLADGTPYNTKVLGRYTGPTRDPAMRARILGTPGVTGIRSYSSDLSRNTRDFSVSAIGVDTVYGAFLAEGPI